MDRSIPFRYKLEAIGFLLNSFASKTICSPVESQIGELSFSSKATLVPKSHKMPPKKQSYKEFFLDFDLSLLEQCFSIFLTSRPTFTENLFIRPTKHVTNTNIKDTSYLVL